MDNTVRGFIVSSVADKTLLSEIAKGNFDSVMLIPVLAKNEEEALEAVRQEGQEPIGVTSLEALEMQAKMITDIAQSNNVSLKRENLYHAH